jgi:Anti-sigma factor N-terminus
VKKGIVLELDEEFVTLLTPEGEFIQVKKEKDYEIGEEIEARVMKKPIVCRRSFRYVITSLVAAVALLVATLFHFPSSEVYAYMSIDINPSIEVGVNEQLKVLKLKAYNKEGKKIISELSHWRKKAFVDITEEIIELSMKKGYLQKGGQVLITTVERKHRAASLRELSTELTKIQHLYQQKNIIVKTEESTMEVRNKAVKKGMTTGKLLQIEQKTKAVPPKLPKIEKPEKPLKQNDRDKKNGQQMNNHSLNEKDEQDRKNNGNEKNAKQMISYPLQKKGQQNWKENNSNEKKEMQQNYYSSEENEEQKKSNDYHKEFRVNDKDCKKSSKNSKYYSGHQSHDHRWKYHRKKNHEQDEYHGEQGYDKGYQKSFQHDEHEDEE